MRRAWAAVIGTAAAFGAVVAVAGCTTSSSGAPDFRPSPTGNNVEGNDGVHVSPIEPVPSGGGSRSNSGGGNASVSPSSEPSSGPTSKSDPFVVATHLTTPVGLSLLPDGTALVGERTTGRIVRVQPMAGQPVPTVRVLHGLDDAGGGGLLDLAVSPHYTEDNLIYAYVTTAKDNRVVDFTLHGPVTPVLTGIPKGPRDNAGRLVFGADGDLYIGTGDAGHPSLASQPNSLAGKILRVDDIGAPAHGNPRKGSPVFATGLRTVAGLCPTSTAMLEVQTGASGRPEVNALIKGANYGYPKPVGRSAAPVVTLPRAADGPGGCAVLDSRLWVTSLSGQALYSAAPKTAGHGFGRFGAVLHRRYGRLRTVVPAKDGALWMTTSNRDGHGHPVPTDERVIRYLPQSDGGGSGKTT